MTNITLTANAESVVVRQGGPATADIWLTINDHDFPILHWNDFIVVVLGWWAAALLRLMCNVSARETVNFMDGPYAVEISKISDGLLQFRALEGVGRSREIAIGDCSPLPFANELVSQARQVLNKCKRLGWWSVDADTLTAVLLALEAEIVRRCAVADQLHES